MVSASSAGVAGAGVAVDRASRSTKFRPLNRRVDRRIRLVAVLRGQAWRRSEIFAEDSKRATSGLYLNKTPRR
jgi:hypothetical protein